MRELLGHDAARTQLLEAIVADRGGGAECFFEIPGIELHLSAGGAAGLGGLVAPHAGVAVGLQLEAHRQGVPVRGIRLLCLAHARLGAADRLNVVSELVRQDVGLGEVAGRAEAALQLVEEAQIEIDLSIAGAIERTADGPGVAAAGLNRVAEERDLRLLVAAAERLGPGLLHVGRDGVDHVDQFFFRGRPGGPS